ncbi:hypothetical protein [Nocardia farcinica]|uniref:DUF3168 domain-containing protein n=1 Tax=Nocardia farcinica (strain IFM 10152) TaxID=247156 RepID=Q5Z3V1_NOCFA|nr:hypothetical protein [Nocardia farcinica]BAD54890.1 hypothetical protein NFA_480 [Nocardia farcinica IFM 10152]
MSKPHRLPPDPAAAIKAYLSAELPALVAAPAPTVGLVLPADWKLTSPPAVVVFDDSGPTLWPVMVKPTIRVTVWSNGRTRARAIAGAALGLLLSQRVAGVATITDPSQLLDARDSSTGGTLASFTVRAQSRTLPA